MQYWVNNRNKILVGLFIALAVLFLFFLPELLNWQYAFYEKDSYPAEVQWVSEVPRISELQDDNALVLESGDVRPLDRISYLIDSGYIESERSRRTSRILRDNYEEGLIEPSWSQLRSSEAISELARLREQAILVLRSLDEDKLAVRRALVDFVGLISFVAGDADQILSARDALERLQAYYLEATRVLAEADVSRAVFLQWSNVELGPLFNQVISEAALRGLRPFNPRLKITEVQVYQGADGYGNRNPKMRPAVRLRGQLQGDDIKSLTLERDGRVVTKFRLQPVAGQQGLWAFEYADRDARGFFKFIAQDIDGNISYKTYQFSSRVEAFPWQNGEFKINFASGDPRLDRIFLVATQRPPRVSGFFDRRGIVQF